MFYDELQRICASKGIRVTNLCEELGISSGNLSKWKAGAAPRFSTVKKIADWLNVSVSEFDPDSKIPVESQKGNRKDMLREFDELLELLTPEQRKAVVDLMKSFLQDKE